MSYSSPCGKTDACIQHHYPIGKDNSTAICKVKYIFKGIIKSTLTDVTYKL